MSSEENWGLKSHSTDWRKKVSSSEKLKKIFFSISTHTFAFVWSTNENLKLTVSSWRKSCEIFFISFNFMLAEAHTDDDDDDGVFSVVGRKEIFG